MLTYETFITFTLACVLIILAPGPDNLLAIARGLSQGRCAASLSALGAGSGLMLHVLAATFGLSMIIKASPLAFLSVKFIGAAYLIYLGYNALKSRSLISFDAKQVLSLKKVFVNGFLTNLLNPKPAFFILAFIPQFINFEAGSMAMQTLILGSWFVVLACVIFSLLGCVASTLSTYLIEHPKIIWLLNVGAGLAFIAAGLSIACYE